MMVKDARTGFGFDAHAFAKHSNNGKRISGGGFMLGGVHIPFAFELIAHSDGDVLLHALCDSLLGAAALGDSGKYFPGDERHQGIDSRELLERVMNLVNDAGFEIVNVDSTIIAEQPRLAPFIPKMSALIASDLQLQENCVNVKVTSTDGLGFVGRGEGIAAFAVVLLARNSSVAEA